MSEFDWTRLEPEAKIKDDIYDSQLSIAISLKRIADILDYQPDGRSNIHDFIKRISEKN